MREPSCRIEAFYNATSKSKTSEIVVLLVDAEDQVAVSTPEGRVAHLLNRDQWDLKSVNAKHVHLMTPCMEAWLVADVETLEAFYGQRFLKGALPKRSVLDEEPKRSLYEALEAATKDTQKGRYGKIKHAAGLLEQLKPEIVADRCTSFRDFTQWLDAVIAED